MHNTNSEDYNNIVTQTNHKKWRIVEF